MDSMRGCGSERDSDAALILGARSDAAAFGVIFDRHATGLHRRVWAMVGDRDVANDLVAETFARAWSRRRRFRDTHDGSAWPWLVGIAVNLTRDYWRRQQVEHRYRDRLGIEYDTPHTDDVEQLEARIDAQARMAALEPFLAALSPSLRAALIARCAYDLSYEQIADQLGCSSLAARIRVSRALRTVRATRVPGLLTNVPNIMPTPSERTSS